MWYSSGSTRTQTWRDGGFKGGVSTCLPQVEFEMAGIVDISEVEEGQGFDVKVDWAGFDEGESSWEPLAIIWGGAP